MVSDVSFDAYPAAYIYEDAPITPVITVKDSQGNALTQDVDYTITFSNNNKVGKAAARVTLQGENYSGTKDFPFAILSDKLKRTNLFVGESKSVAIDASVTEILGNDISFSVEDPSIATVDADGVVTGVAPGKTVLTAAIGDLSFKSDINVIKKQTPTLITEVAKDDYEWCCSYYFTSDGTESFRVEVYGAWLYLKPYKAEVLIWDQTADRIIKEVDLKNGVGTVEFGSSYFTKGRDYSIYVWCDTDDLDDVDDEEDTWVAAAIYSVPAPEAIAFDETSYEMITGDTP